jgi:hypothetical protein
MTLDRIGQPNNIGAERALRDRKDFSLINLQLQSLVNIINDAINRGRKMPIGDPIRPATKHGSRGANAMRFRGDCVRVAVARSGLRALQPAATNWNGDPIGPGVAGSIDASGQALTR